MRRAATEFQQVAGRLPSLAAGPSLLALALVGDRAYALPVLSGELLEPSAQTIWAAGALLAGRPLPVEVEASVGPERKELLVWRQENAAGQPLPAPLRAVLGAWRSELSLTTEDDRLSALRLALEWLFRNEARA